MSKFKRFRASCFAILFFPCFSNNPVTDEVGTGIERIRLPVISEIAGGVNVIIYANRDTLKGTIKDTIKETLTNGEKEAVVMQKIREKPTVTADELSKILNINLRNTMKYLTQLKEQGKIMRMGSRKTGYWQVVIQE